MHAYAVINENASDVCCGVFAWVYVVSMATISPEAVVRYFSGDSSALPEYFFGGSDDELSMEDPESDIEPEHKRYH